MEISQVHNAPKVQARSVSVIFNPTQTERADVVLYDSKTATPKLSEEQVCFDGAGEYEVKDTSIEGVATGTHTSYAISSDGLRAVRLGEGTTELNDAQQEALSSVDILMVPCAGLTPEQVSKLVSTLEPRVIIPLESDAAMLKKLEAELGVKPEKTAKFKATARDLPSDTQKLVVIE